MEAAISSSIFGIHGRQCHLRRPIRDRSGRGRFREMPVIAREVFNLDRHMYLVKSSDCATTFVFPDENLASPGASDFPDHSLGPQLSFCQPSASYDFSPAGLTMNRNFTIVRSQGFRDRASKMFAPWVLLTNPLLGMEPVL